MASNGKMGRKRFALRGSIPARAVIVAMVSIVAAAGVSVWPSSLVYAADAPPTLDTKRKYKVKYANGVLPLGDGKISTAGAKKGSIFSCKGADPSKPGAEVKGPWFTGSGYNTKTKLKVAGRKTWDGEFSNTPGTTARVITTQSLPRTADDPTGDFPIPVVQNPTDTDPYKFDKNPSSISAQKGLKYQLPMSPKVGNPVCVDSAEIGIMLNGVVLFNGLDAKGRDAGAWEVQDHCDGHPVPSGKYHYHSLSSCIKDKGVKTVLGFALDGFPITGPVIAADSVLTTEDLDECHGIVSEIVLDGKKVTTYHYVMTQDYPYSVSCYRSAPAKRPGSAGKDLEPGKSDPNQPGQSPPTQRPSAPPKPAQTGQRIPECKPPLIPPLLPGHRPPVPPQHSGTLPPPPRGCPGHPDMP